ncbi:hypothetical protein EVAR_41699_1 [Eumeta japonica]|uniref:Uncharacterized protein n=1 Tax=Eumeta variegata TaxID=151549 RepID=A0A4C1VR04_EUMVA|nr:hypothetical protein EVAR_41699_1 [Eumeta japonica]
MFCSENDVNKKKRSSKERARKGRHRTDSKLNTAVSSQPPSLNDDPSLRRRHHSNVGRTQSSSATASNTSSPSTKSVSHLNRCQRDCEWQREENRKKLHCPLPPESHSH